MAEAAEESMTTPKCDDCEGPQLEKHLYSCETYSVFVCDSCAADTHGSDEHTCSKITISSYRKKVIGDLQENKRKYKANNESTDDQKNRLNVMVTRAHNDISAMEKREIADIQKKALLLRQKVTEIAKEREREFKRVQTNNETKMNEAEAAVTDLLKADDSELLMMMMKNLKLEKDLQFERVKHGQSFVAVQCPEVDQDRDLGHILLKEIWLMTEFGKEGHGKGEFNYAVGIGCFSNGDIAVTDFTNKRLSVFTSSGRFKAKTDLNAEYGIAITSDDRLLAHCDDHVKVFDINCKVTSSFKLPYSNKDNSEQRPQGKCIVGIAVVDESQVAVNDVKTGVTLLMSLDGSLIKTIPNKDSIPTSIAADKKGRLLSVSYRERALRCVDLNGEELFNVSTDVDGKECYPYGICFDKEGDIYVKLDCGKTKGNNEVHRYDSEGVYVGCVAENLNWPYGIALSPNGELVVADQYSVKIFHQYTMPSTPHGTFKCGIPNCVVCSDYIQESDTFSGRFSGTPYQTLGRVTCHTSGVIYLISCKRCGFQYVGETGDTLKTRFTNHKSNVKANKSNTHLVTHFNRPDHSFSDMKLQGIESLGHVSDVVRFSREKQWIKRLSTLHPHGLNDRGKT